jgi:hypothetical protein
MMTIVDRFRAASRRVALELLVPAEPEIMREREALLCKMYSADGLTRAEKRRMAVLRELLDRIDDALYGPALDELEQNFSPALAWIGDYLVRRDRS